MTNDLISRQAAIASLGEEPRIIGDEESDIFMQNQWRRDVNALKGVPAAQRWIPVTERLPEEDEEVNVTILDDNGDTPFRYVATAWYYKGIWVANNERTFGVVAWMPLPEPAKLESD